MDNDHLDASGVAVGEAHGLQTGGGDGHTGHSHMGFARLDGGNSGVELHVVNDQLASHRL